MAESSGRGGLGWLWLLLAVMVLVGAFVTALAFLFPEGIKFSQPVATAPLEQVAPLEEDAQVADIDDIMSDPSRYIGKKVVVTVRVTDIVTDRILWLGSREYSSNGEMFAVVASGIDLKGSDFRIYQIARVYGSIRPFEEEDLKSQGLEIGRRIKAALTTEKGYLLIEGLIANNPDLQLLQELERERELQERLELEQQQAMDEGLDPEEEQGLVDGLDPEQEQGLVDGLDQEQGLDQGLDVDPGPAPETIFYPW